MTVETGLLVDYPEHLPTVADWIYREWGRWRPGSSPAQVAQRLRSHLRRDHLPLMVLALDGLECVGCASLRTTDLDGRAELTPWLASVYVPESRRGAGIGAQLVRTAEVEARRLQAPNLYLFTPDRQRFYAGLGWAAYEELVHAGRTVTIMHKRLASELSTRV